jgi:hypothetical protein
MHRSESEELLRCAACGDLIDPGTGRPYAFGTEDAVLCFDCAVERGGSYDGVQERWTRAPRVADLERGEG